MTSSSSSQAQRDIIQSSIGSIGRWQIFICLTIFLVKFSIGWHQLGIVFLAPPVSFNCSEPYTNVSKCSKDCLSHDFDRSIFTETIVTQWDLVCERAQLANVAQLTFMLGVLLGNVFFGYLSDRYGRRNPLVLAVILQGASGVAASFSPELWIFITLRFFCALATGGTMLTSFVIVMEIVGLKHRTLLGILFQIPFNFGHASLGLFGYYLRDWHYFQLAISVPSLILISYYWLVPESPRWLLTVGRIDESIEILQRAAKTNHLPTYTIKKNVETYVQETKTNQSQHGGNICDLFKTYEMRIRTICVFMNWFITGLVFFGVAQFMGQISGNIFINVGISGLVQVPGNLCCIYLMDKVGRKLSLIICYVLIASSCLIIPAVPNDIPWATTVLGGIGMMAAAVGFSIIYVYSGELYPTTIRNIGMGTSSMFARFGSMFAPFITSLSLHRQWLPPLFFGIFPLAAIVITLRLPETLNHKLPDTIAEAEQLSGPVKKIFDRNEKE